MGAEQFIQTVSAVLLANLATLIGLWAFREIERMHNDDATRAPYVVLAALFLPFFVAAVGAYWAYPR